MSYLLQVEHEDGTLLYNLVTGHLVLLSSEEGEYLRRLPCVYDEVASELLVAHFIVPCEYDECRKVVQIRSVLNKIEQAKKKELTYYTILPTTACNARCFYCFEADVKKVSMTEQTASDVVSYIADHYCGKNVSLRWFGGEPTVAHRIINKISLGLKSLGIEFTSQMVTNGYLFDEGMVERAYNHWNLRSIQITIDGTEEVYNQVKSYVGVKDNPYLRVMNNVKLLLDADVKVSIRLNIDRHNIDDIYQLIAELRERFSCYHKFNVYAWPVFGGCGFDPVHHDDNDNLWLSKRVAEVNGFIEECGFYQGVGDGLPVLNCSSCMADNDRTIVIRPEGYLVRCLERFDEKDIVGDVKHGITNKPVYEAWKEIIVHEMCRDCAFFPKCVRLRHCSESNLCYKKDIYVAYNDTIVKIYENKK